jgi:hypothetical protein
VHHEPDDQERAERELAEGDRRADRQPSPRLCSPIPIATSVASATPSSGASARARARPRSAARRTSARGSSRRRRAGSGRALEALGDRPAVERLRERVDAEEAQQPAVSAMKPRSSRAAARRDGSQRARARPARPRRASRSARSRGTRARCAARLDRGGDVEGRLDPARARHADGVRVVLDPLERDDDRARAQPAERRGPSTVNGTIASSTVTVAIVSSAAAGSSRGSGSRPA